jgi:FOG: PKD repeat
MACTVTIGSVVGFLPPGATTPASIVVTGTATGCATGEIKVTIDCGAGAMSLSVPVDATGSWTATFGSNVQCTCQKPITVRAACSDGACEATQSAPLTCQATGACPQIKSFTVAVDGCAGGGASATVLFTVTLSPPTSGCTYTWNFGDGSPLQTTTVPSVTHVYATAGTFNALVVVNCPPVGGLPCTARATATVVVPPCSSGGCPTVVGLTAAVSGCAGPGSATVTFTGTLVPPLPGCLFLWAFGDMTNATTTTPSASHVYTTPNTYAVAVTAICPGIPPCATTTIAVVVPRCCPVVTNIVGNVEDSECADGATKSATFNFSAVTDPSPAAGNYNWDFGDGSPTVTNPGPNASHAYSASGMHTASVVYVPDPGLYPSCPPSSFSISVTVPACSGGGNGGNGNGGDGEGFGCFGLRAIMTIAGILAIVALALAACIPPAASILLAIAAGFGLVAAIVGLIWGFLCPKPCAWALLLAWQVAIGAGYMLLCFTTCCPSFWPIGIGMIVVGIGLMLLWKSHCHKNKCQVLKELVLAISGVLIPLLGWFGAIPILAPCINHVVTAALSALAAALTVAALHCIP